MRIKVNEANQSPVDSSYLSKSATHEVDITTGKKPIAVKGKNSIRGIPVIESQEKSREDDQIPVSQYLRSKSTLLLAYRMLSRHLAGDNGAISPPGTARTAGLLYKEPILDQEVWTDFAYSTLHMQDHYFADTQNINLIGYSPPWPNHRNYLLYVYSACFILFILPDFLLLIRCLCWVYVATMLLSITTLTTEPVSSLFV